MTSVHPRVSGKLHCVNGKGALGTSLPGLAVPLPTVYVTAWPGYLVLALTPDSLVPGVSSQSLLPLFMGAIS